MEYIKCLETQAQCLLEPLLVEEATNLRSGSAPPVSVPQVNNDQGVIGDSCPIIHMKLFH